MRSKTSFRDALSKTFKVEFMHSGKDRVRFFKTFEEAKMFASNFSQYQITKPEVVQ